MKAVKLTNRAKVGYSIAAAIFLLGAVFEILELFWGGLYIAIAGICFAFGVAGVNGHLTRRNKPED